MSSGLDHSRVEKALDVLDRRGPDERGWRASPDGRFALGHSRLGDIGFQNGHQPMFKGDRRLAMIVPSAIGVRRTRTDTVVVAPFRKTLEETLEDATRERPATANHSSRGLQEKLNAIVPAGRVVAEAPLLSAVTTALLHQRFGMSA
jgi:hypothetical protein